MRPNLEMKRNLCGRGWRGPGSPPADPGDGSAGNREGWDGGSEAGSPPFAAEEDSGDPAAGDAAGGVSGLWGLLGGAGSGLGCPGSLDAEGGTIPAEGGRLPLFLAALFIPLPRSLLAIAKGNIAYVRDVGKHFFVYIGAMASSGGMRMIPVRGSTEKSVHHLDPSRLEQVRVAENAEVAPGIYRLAFARPWDFIPGQCVALTLDPRQEARFYSIASGAQEPAVEVLYDLVPDGELTPRLALLAPGDELFCSAPFGAFRDAEGPSCWVATGTGVAPFVSMARSRGTAGKLLLHGSRSLAGLLERPLFASMGDRYVPCCSREKGEGVFEGRTTAWLSQGRLPAAERYLLCGNSEMVVEARDILIGRGVPFADVVAEIYF